MVIVLGAMPEEIQGIAERITGAHTEPLIPGSSREIIRGRFVGTEVLLAHSGVGKVAAAMTASILLERCRGAVEYLLFVGVAGGLGSEVALGDLVLARDTLQHDVDATALNSLGLNLVRGQHLHSEVVAVPCDVSLVRIAQQYADSFDRVLHVGRVLSGDQFIDGRIRKQLGYLDDLDALAVEMEGAAVGAVCQAFSIPHLVVRTISDLVDEGGAVSFSNFVKSIAIHNTVGIVEYVIQNYSDRVARSSI